ncbi:MAG: phage portal protein [Planctomycetota bacterium]|nr:MAG: phage portal protein [Planctomycetota bacterium]
MWKSKKQKLNDVFRTRRVRNVRRKIRKSKEVKLKNEITLLKMKRKFASAKTGRLIDDWKAGTESINSDIKNSITKVRQRSKDLSLNNDYIKKYLKLFRKNVVGDQGFRLKSLARDLKSKKIDENAVDVIEETWKDFCKPENFSVTGELSYFKFMTMFASQYPTDGEYFVQFVVSDKFKYGFALQVIDSRLLDHELNKTLKNDHYIRLGIEFDEMGKRIAYYFKKYGAPSVNEYNFNTKNYNVVSAEFIIHIYDKEDCVQVRGYPLTQISLIKSHNISSYEESELISARVASNKMGFFQQVADSDAYMGDVQDDGSIVTEAEAGTFEILPVGYSFKEFDPNHPNGNMPDFVKNQLRGIASGLDVSYNTLASDGEGINFSTMRSFALDDRDGWKLIQRMVKEDLLSPIFIKFIEMALLKKKLGNLPVHKIESFKLHEFKARTFAWVDPYKDMLTNALAVKMGIKSRIQICNEIGEDFNELMEDLAKENKIALELGVDISGATVSISKSGELENENQEA